MNILMVGGDTKGAWQMRGVQLGRAMGARVTAKPEAGDWSWADLVILVKRAAIMWAEHALVVKVPVVWDVLDFWAQPQDNQETREEMIERVRHIQRNCGAGLLIGATRSMADDIGGAYLPHQCRVGLRPEPIRKHAQVVAYDGNRKYLGAWGKALQRSCESLGLTFMVSPSHLSKADVLVAFRDGKWDGWVCRQWKSGVKQVNSIVAGRPMLSQPSAAQSELSPIGATVESIEELTEALRRVTCVDVRSEAHRVGVRWHSEFQVDAVAARYLDILQHAERRAA